MHTTLGAMLIPMALYLVPMGIMIVVIVAARRFYQPKSRRNPLTSELLRPPGHSLEQRLDDVSTDAMATMAAVLPIPLYMFATTALMPKGANWYILGAFFIGGTVYVVVRLVRRMKKARDLRLGLDAEKAVGQELATLMRDGYWVFHDVPSDQAFNVDHVVVGPGGVFAVETKGRAKRVRADGNGHRVTLRDGQLEFPGWTETEPLAQARRQAEWLGRWLSKATGEPVKPQPVLALPGWYIDRQSRGDVVVINGKNPQGYFLKAKTPQLNDAQIERIRHQLDQRCRDIAPSAYRPKATGSAAGR